MIKLEKGRISQSDVMWYVFSSIFATAILFVPATTVLHAHQDAWLSILWALIFGVLVSYIAITLGKRFPNKTVVEYSTDITGFFLGKIIGLIYVLYFFYVAFFVQHEFLELIVVTLLPTTPGVIIIAVLTMITCYMLYSGLEVIVRTNRVVLYVSLFFAILIILLSLPLVKTDNFFPMLEHGLAPSLRGAWTPAAWFSESAIVLMLIPFVNKTKGLIKTNINALLLLTFFLSLSIITSVGILGVELTKISHFPIYSVVHRIEYPVESFFLVLWIATMVTKLATFFYAGTLGLGQWLQLKDYRPLILPMAVILTALSLLSWNDIAELKEFTATVFPPSIIFVNFILTLFLLAVAGIRKKRQQSNDPKTKEDQF